MILTGKGRKTRIVPIMDTTGRHVDHYLHVFHPDRQQHGDTPLFFTTAPAAVRRSARTT